MGMEMGGGLRMRNTCKPVADSCQCMAKSIQYCKVKKKKMQKNKKKERKTINILLQYSTIYMGKNIFSGIPSIKRTDKNVLISFNFLNKFLLKYCCLTVLC